MKTIYQTVNESSIIFHNGAMYAKPVYKFDPKTMTMHKDVAENVLNIVEKDINGRYVSMVCKLGDALNVKIPEGLFVVQS